MLYDEPEMKVPSIDETAEFVEHMRQRGKMAEQSIKHLERELLAQRTILDMATAALAAHAERQSMGAPS